MHSPAQNGQYQAQPGLPPNIMAYAQAHDLGYHRATFRAQKLGFWKLFAHVFLGLMFLVLVVGLYVFYLMFQTPNFNKRQAARCLHFFEKGLIIADADGPVHSFRWDTLTALQSIIDHRINGIHVRTSYEYRLFKPDGSQVKLTEFYENPEQWGVAIQQEITEAQVPATLVGLQAGLEYRFGPITLNAQGITKGRKSIEWSAVQGIKIAVGYIHIQRAGKWMNWSGQPIKKIPNAFVFISVVQHLAGIHNN